MGPECPEWPNVPDPELGWDPHESVDFKRSPPRVVYIAAEGWSAGSSIGDGRGRPLTASHLPA